MSVTPTGYRAVSSGESDECLQCGALVVDRDRHTRFHEDLTEDHKLAAGGQFRVKLYLRDEESSG